ncbi:hypothetical protein PGT21_001662 [Puccinia graminis f. sp. tritici]|uniref:Uncharacterized protein n=1 Tax=Puccinia graminis f. sp. tritici TaxID=56615 RepID=A0A5B0MVE2_PUCGR|nr:hypothetical protein PGT21_001662 [Puccinia graminis f. sp. tritici]
MVDKKSKMSESRSLLRDGHLSLTTGQRSSRPAVDSGRDPHYSRSGTRPSKAFVAQGDILELWPGVPTLALTTD